MDPRRLAALLVATALVIALCSAPSTLPGTGEATAATRVVYTLSTKLEVRQVRASREGEQPEDSNLDESVLRALRARYKSRYKCYTMVKKDAYEARMGEWYQFDLGDEKTGSIKVHGYKPGPKIINLRIRIEGVEVKVDLADGRHWFAIVKKGDEPVILAVTASLVQAGDK